MGRFKLVLFVVAILAGVYVGNAQAQDLEIGVRGGYGRSNEVTATIVCALECGPSEVSHHFPRVAPVGGVVLRRQQSARLALRGELMLAPKGYGPGDERSDWRVAAQYLEAPLLVDVELLPVGAGRLQLSGGLAPAVLISCRVGGTTVDGFIRAGCSERVKATAASYGPAVAYDLGGAIAPGLRWPTPSGSMLLELRHTRGLVDIQPDRGGRTRNRTTVASVTAAWRRK